MEGATAACLVVLTTALHGIERAVRVSGDLVGRRARSRALSARVDSTAYLAATPTTSRIGLKDLLVKPLYLNNGTTNLTYSYRDLNKAFSSIFCTSKFLNKVLW